MSRAKLPIRFPDWVPEPARRRIGELRETPLRGIANSIRILRLPGLPSAGDVSDWLADGGSAEALWQIVDATAQWAPSEVDRPKESSGLVTVCAALIVPERISWLWRGRLARGKRETYLPCRRTRHGQKSTRPPL